LEYNELGSSGVTAPNVALGVMRINTKSAREAAAIVGTAVDHGITFFDTADCYAAGDSSERLGQALKDGDIARDRVLLQTKVGIYQHPGTGTITRYDFSSKHILEAVDGELRRLQTDHVDFLLLHRPDTLVDLPDLASAFDELERDGKVLHFGVSNVNPMQVDLLQSALSQKLEINQLQFGLGHTGMLDQEFHVNMNSAPSIDHDGGLLAYSRLHHMTIQAWSPFQFGFFDGVFLDNPKFPELNAALNAVAQHYGVSKSAVAVAWILRHPAHMQVLLGSMTPSRIADMAAGTDVHITAQEWYDLYVAAGNDLP
jgi:predicted oxidoreductase